MNNIMFKALSRLIGFTMVITVFAAVAGCETNDDRSHCTARMTLRFEYTLNKDLTDRFTTAAESVDVFVYDEYDAFVSNFRFSRSAGTLGNDNTVLLTLPHGRMKVVAWANLDDRYACTYDCSLKGHRVEIKTGTGSSVSDKPADIMHGTAEIAVANKNSDSETVVSMTKNTNNINVILNTTGKSGPVALTDFTVSVTGSNGSYNYDNSPAQCSPINYIPGYALPEEDTFTASARVLRLCSDGDMRLVISRGPGSRTAIELPYERSLTEEIMKHPSYNSDQDLDRFDQYTLTYEVDMTDFGYWSLTLLQINDWIVDEWGGSIGN